MEIHDSHNLEITSNYDLLSPPLQSEMETYLFFPRSLGLTEVPVFSILGDIQVRMRLSGRSREKRARQMVEHYLSLLENHASQTSPVQLNPREVREIFLKLGSLMGDWFTTNRIFIRKRLALYEEEDKNTYHLNKIFQIGRTGLELLDRNIQRLRSLKSSEAFQGLEEPGLIDEYLSQRYVVYLDSVSSALKRVENSGLKETYIAGLEAFKASLARVLKKEATESPPEVRLLGTPESEDWETKLIRYGYLKKYFQSESFVELYNSVTREKMVEPIAIFAGALAGLIAALAVVASWFIASPQTQQSLQVVTTFILFLTVIYILRDRLKEHSKIYLTRRLSSIIPNRKAELRHQGEKLGQLKTWVEVNPAAPETPEVTKERQRASILSVDSLVPEDLLVVRRTFSFEKLSRNRREIKPHLHDIVRINLHRYLKYMHEPNASMTLVTSDGEIEKIPTHRRYILFLVVVLKVGNPDSDAPSQRTMKTFRIQLDKDGIQKLELVGKQKDEVQTKSTFKSKVISRI